jgi:hypothetical protein
MQPNPDLKICYDRIIPEDMAGHHPELQRMREQALLHATGAASPREAFHTLDPTVVIPPPHLALIASKAWPVGSRLRCRFLEGSPTQRERVVQKAKMWEQYANIHIDFVTTHSEHVRIAFQAGEGSWSAIGHDALNRAYFRATEPTMNFGWLTDTTDDALGCIHEHQSPTEKLKWNVDAVLAAFSGPPNNWDRATIESNILDKYSHTGIHATVFDRDSIMLYQFPAELFLDHEATPLNTKLSKKDKAYIAHLYPRH